KIGDNLEQSNIDVGWTERLNAEPSAHEAIDRNGCGRQRAEAAVDQSTRRRCEHTAAAATQPEGFGDRKCFEGVGATVGGGPRNDVGTPRVDAPRAKLPGQLGGCRRLRGPGCNLLAAAPDRSAHVDRRVRTPERKRLDERGALTGIDDAGHGDAVVEEAHRPGVSKGDVEAEPRTDAARAAAEAIVCRELPRKPLP